MPAQGFCLLWVVGDHQHGFALGPRQEVVQHLALVAWSRPLKGSSQKRTSYSAAGPAGWPPGASSPQRGCAPAGPGCPPAPAPGAWPPPPPWRGRGSPGGCWTRRWSFRTACPLGTRRIFFSPPCPGFSRRPAAPAPAARRAGWSCRSPRAHNAGQLPSGKVWEKS